MTGTGLEIVVKGPNDGVKGSPRRKRVGTGKLSDKSCVVDL